MSKRLLCVPIFQRSAQCHFRKSFVGRSWISLGVGIEQKRWINIKKELKEVHYCSGCGARLHYGNEALFGYIPRDVMENCLEHNESPICQRCHKVRAFVLFHCSYDTIIR